MLKILQYYRRSTGVLTAEYWSTSAIVLAFTLNL